MKLKLSAVIEVAATLYSILAIKKYKLNIIIYNYNYAYDDMQFQWEVRSAIHFQVPVPASTDTN